MRTFGLLLLAGCLAAGAPPALARGGELRAIERIDRDVDALSWGGIRLGMTVLEVEEVLRTRLPISEVPRTDLGCAADYGTTVRHKGVALGLGFDRPGRSGRLRELTLILPGPAREELVGAVKDRFPGLRHVSPRSEPDLPERDADRPLYRTSFGDLVHVLPGVGVSLGAVCGVEPAADAVSERRGD
jgi:hypothetical protein